MAIPLLHLRHHAEEGVTRRPDGRYAARAKASRRRRMASCVSEGLAPLRWRHGTLVRCVESWPPTSIITVSRSYRNETGTACGCPSAEVAIRGRHWDWRWAVSAGVRTMAHPHTTTTYRQRIGALAQLGLEFHGVQLAAVPPSLCPCDSI